MKQLYYKILNRTKEFFNSIILWVIAPLMRRHYHKWYAWQFRFVPWRKHFSSNEGLFTSLVIIPTKHIHDSGFICMDFVGIRDEKPVCRLSGCSDVIHVDGIGGYGYRWASRGKGVPLEIPISGWSIDCLPRSRYMRMFCNNYILVGEALSSFEIYAQTKSASAN